MPENNRRVMFYRKEYWSGYYGSYTSISMITGEPPLSPGLVAGHDLAQSYKLGRVDLPVIFQYFEMNMRTG